MSTPRVRDPTLGRRWQAGTTSSTGQAAPLTCLGGVACALEHPVSGALVQQGSQAGPHRLGLVHRITVWVGGGGGGGWGGVRVRVCGGWGGGVGGVGGICERAE